MNPLPSIFGLTITRLHLLGAGGMGLAPLGIYLARLGFKVSGDDDGWNPGVRTLLERAGVSITASGALPDDAELVEEYVVVARRAHGTASLDSMSSV